MAVDQELQSHQETWLGFTRIMRWAVALIALVLIGMALFLL